MQVDTSVAEADVGKLSPQMQATFHRRRVSNRALQGHGAPDPQRAADGAERGHLRRGHRRRQHRPEAQAGHDRERHLRLRREGRRLARANAALRFRPTPEMLADKGDRPAHAASTGGAQAAVPPRRSRATAANSGDRPAPSATERRSVWVERDGRPSQVPIRIGVTDGTITEIVEGDLKEGDLVITDSAPAGKAASAPAGGDRRCPRTAVLVMAALLHLAGRHQDLQDGRRRGARAARREHRHRWPASSSPSWAAPARASRR